MTAWRKGKVDVARHHQEKREATRLGKLLSHTQASVEFYEATPIALADESKYSLNRRETNRDLRSA